jgi:hypothetical protein
MHLAVAAFIFLAKAAAASVSMVSMSLIFWVSSAWRARRKDVRNPRSLRAFGGNFLEALPFLSC